MKALSFILALASIPAFIAQADEKAGAWDGYLPTDGTLKRGAHVQLVVTDSFRDQWQNFANGLQKLDPEKRKAYMEIYTPELQPPYQADIWPNKEDYNKFIEGWKKLPQPVRLVAVGLQDLGNGIWRVLSATEDGKTKQQIPLTISAMRYDANRNAWISNNGELTAKEYTSPDTHIYGARTGTEWVLEKSDDLTRLRESICITKSTDGKFVYLSYKLDEFSAITGMNIANGEYVLQFPVQTPGANLGTPGQR